MHQHTKGVSTWAALQVMQICRDELDRQSFEKRVMAGRLAYGLQECILTEDLAMGAAGDMSTPSFSSGQGKFWPCSNASIGKPEHAGSIQLSPMLKQQNPHLLQKLSGSIRIMRSGRDAHFVNASVLLDTSVRAPMADDSAVSSTKGTVAMLNPPCWYASSQST